MDREPDIVTTAATDDVAYLRTHPDVAAVEAVRGRRRNGVTPFELRLWLKDAGRR